MSKKTGVTFPVLQGLVGFAFLLVGLLRLFAPRALTGWALISMGVSIAACVLLSLLVRHAVISQKERDDMEKKNRVGARDERNIRLREKSAYVSQWFMLCALCAAVVAAGFVRPFSAPLFGAALGLLCLHCFLPLLLSRVLARRI